MDFSRIDSVIDIERMQCVEITVFGAGGSAGLTNSLVRSGARRFNLFDPDCVTSSNIARQAHDAEFLETPKVEALAAALYRTNPDVDVRRFVRDITTMTDAEIDEAAGASDLLINATDSFRASARGNEIALRLGIPALWVGLYPKGLAGEVIWWTPQIDACHRCLCAKRYAAHEQAAATGRSLDPSSDGCTIFDITLLDSIAGMIAVSLLTQGANNRFGCLIQQLNDRNFIQVQIDPSWNFNGRNPIRELLGVASDSPAFFAWNTIVRSDPDRGQLPCPDCERFRGHRFVREGDVTRRIKPDDLPTVGAIGGGDVA